MGRFLEQRPEVVPDHVRGNLPAAHRPANKGAHKILGVIEHELITRHGRDRFKGFKRVGAAARPVTRQRSGMPVAAVEQLLDPLELLLAHRVSDVGFVHDHALYRHQPVIERGARIIIWTAGSDQINRLTARRARTHPLEEMPRHAVVKIRMGKEQVFEQPAPDQRLC